MLSTTPASRWSANNHVQSHMCNHTHAKKQRGREREREGKGGGVRGKAHLCELHSRCSWHSRASVRCAASYNSDPLRCANADHPQAAAPKPPPHPLLDGDHGASALLDCRREAQQLQFPLHQYGKYSSQFSISVQNRTNLQKRELAVRQAVIFRLVCVQKSLRGIGICNH